jgi:hypothetical protein
MRSLDLEERDHLTSPDGPVAAVRAWLDERGGIPQGYGFASRSRITDVNTELVLLVRLPDGEAFEVDSPQEVEALTFECELGAEGRWSVALLEPTS